MSATGPTAPLRASGAIQGGFSLQGPVDCFCTILRKEGARALYHGAHSNLYWTVGPALALAFYDQLQGMLGLNLDTGSE
ncbi:hypothetical protein QOT17_016646 [Balamuthia mandrillaris]